MHPIFRRKAIAAAVFSTMFGTSHAATFTVDSLLDTADANPGDGVAEDASGATTLRAAIEEAEALAGADTIEFAAALVSSGDAAIELNAGSIDSGADAGELGPTAFIIGTDVTITGPAGDNGITIERPDSNTEFRLFHVMSAGSLTLNNLHMTGGFAQGGAGAGPGGSGGGGGAAGLGGGILNEGDLTLSHSTLSNNRVLGGLGAASGAGTRSGGGGGGLAGDGATTSGGGPNAGIGNGNNATGVGGGGAGGGESSGAGPGSAGDGGNGGMFGGGGGGGPRLSTGGGSPVANGGDGGDGGFGGGGAGGGRAFSFNGPDNRGFGGAGGFGAGDGTDGSTSNNGPGGDGGGGAGLGGAIFNNGGTVTVENSTISGNTATGGSSTRSNYGSPVLPATGNGGAGSGYGAAIFNLNGTVSIRTSTIAGNSNIAGETNGGTAGSAGGSIFNLGDSGTANLTIDGSIVADTTGGNDIVSTTINGGTANTPLNNGFNLVESQTGFTGGVASTADPQLAALADNRGPTPTHAIPATSPAIDAGTNIAATVPSVLSTDQRRGIFARITDGDLNGSAQIDIGAFELTQIDYGDAPDFITGKGPTTLLFEQGGDDFRISSMGDDSEVDPTVRDNFSARESNVVYNATQDEFFVVWLADDDTGSVVDNENEIYGQRINATTGALVGSRIRISFMGPDGDTNFRGDDPSVAWNSTDNQYLVVWQGEDDTGPLVDNESEAFGQRINGATGALLGGQIRISVMGNDAEADPAIRDDFRANDPAVVYNATDNRYLVTWHGNTDTLPPLVANEQEVFGRFVEANGTTPAAQFRISVMGDDTEADPTIRDDFRANDTRIAWNSAANNYMVVWVGDDGQGGLVDNEQEVWNRIVNANGTLGAQTRTSVIGVDGDTNFGPPTFDQPPGIAYSPTDNQFLVTWVSDAPPTNGDQQAYGQRVSAAGARIGGDFQLSQMGPPGNTSFSASDIATTYNASTNSFLTVWRGDDEVDNKVDVYGRRVTFDASPATTTTINDEDDIRISHMGSGNNNDIAFNAFNPAATANGSGRFFSVWDGDDDTAPLVNGESEIFGQFLDDTAVVDYETRGSDDGPAHRRAQGLFIGTNIDDESDGQPNLAATGDDTNGGPDDEDGLVSPVTFGATANFMVPVTNTTGSAATLYGWIDFNGDGMFDNATERTSAPVPDGTMGASVALNFGATPLSSVNNTYLRMRLSTQAGAADPTGLVDDGEVEDYAAEFTIDVTPDAFMFTDQTNVPLSSQRTSNTVTISSIDIAVTISVTGGEYSINGGAFTSVAGMVSSGDMVQVRHTSSGSFSTATDTVLTVGAVSDTFTSTTLAADTTPDGFLFTDQTDVPLSSQRTSNTITVAGLNTAAPISVTGGTYSINGGAFTAVAGTVVNGDMVEVRHTSSGAFSTATNTTLDIGGVMDTFTSTTLAEDTTPDAFLFTDQTDVPLSSQRTSNTITVAGINSMAAISVTGGTYSINGGAFTAVAGTVVNGDMVQVRHTSSGAFSTATNTVLTIGGVMDTFTSTTLAADTTPNAFNFVDQTDVPLSDVRTSAAITITGINTMAPISVAGGTYSINGGAFTAAAGMVVNGNMVQVRHTSSAAFSTATDTILTVGGVMDTFTSTTLAEDTTPDAFSFVDQVDVPVSTLRTSNAITVAGINSNAPISVTGGEYSINGGAFTAAPGTVADGDMVTVRHTSDANPSTATDTILTIGGVSDTFTSTTIGDMVPDAFSFTDQTDVPLSDERTSDPVTIMGIDTATPISVVGGTYSINGGAFTAAPGTVNNGDMVRVRHTSSGSFVTATDTTLDVGGVTDTFTSTTEAEDTTPDAFSFTDVTDVEPLSEQTSDAITVAGINSMAAISVVGGTYSINGGAFTAVAGTVVNGDMVRVRHTAAMDFEADVDTTLTIDAVSDTFTSTTRDDGDGVPSAVEDAGPNGGDGNNDGIPDSQQENVTTLPTATGNGDMTLEVSGACTMFQNVAAVNAGSIPTPPPVGEDFAFGLASFTLPCETATVAITFHNAVDLGASQYFKYGPTTPGNPATTRWYPFGSFATVNGNTWTLDLEDNRLGDDTGDDGMIVEPGGPSVAVRPVPTLSGWALALLASMTGLFGLLAGRKRKGDSD